MGRTENGLVTALRWALFTQAALYFIYFVVLPQHWTLLDDYTRAVTHSAPDFSFWPSFVKSFRASMDVGRLKPLNELSMALRMDFLPFEPRTYRLIQWLITVGVHVLFYKIIRRLGMSSLRALFGVFCASLAFSVKDMVQYWTISEPAMLFFLFLSFLLFLSGRIVGVVLCFTAALLFKEPAVAFLGVFFLYAILAKKTLSRPQIKTLILLTGVAVMFLGYLRTLPVGYTSNYSTSRLSVYGLLVALVVPVVKNYTLVLLILAAAVIARRPRFSKIGLIIGLAIALGYTLVLAPWGPFDSWYYLHIPIPFGWALVFASVCPDGFVRQEDQLWATRAVALLFVFGLFVTVNGSTNYRQFNLEGRWVAGLVCEEAQRHPGVPFFSNCQEAAAQLQNLARIEHLCDAPPEVAHVPVEAFDKKIAQRHNPYVFVYSPKCDYPIVGLSTPFRTEFRYWTIYKNFTR